MKWAQRQKSCRYIENCVKMELHLSRNRYAWVLRGDTFWFTFAKIISHACTIMQFSNMKPCTLTHHTLKQVLKYLNKKPTTSLIFRYPLIVLPWLWFLRSDTRHSWLLTVVSSSSCPHSSQEQWFMLSTEHLEYYHTQRPWVRFWGPKNVAASCTHLGPAQVMEVIIIDV